MMAVINLNYYARLPTGNQTYLSCVLIHTDQPKHFDLPGKFQGSAKCYCTQQLPLQKHTMKFLSLQPFVPSGENFEMSKELFIALGFKVNWDADGYAGLERDGCKFILQHFTNREFAENFMISVGVDNADEFRNEVLEKKIPEKFGIRISEVQNQPYGREVNIIDIAGVCWHFVQ